MVLQFLTKFEAQKEFNSSNYLKSLSVDECHLKLGILYSNSGIIFDNNVDFKKCLHNVYLNNCMDFTLHEQEVLFYLFMELDKIISNNVNGSLFSINQIPFKMIKLNSVDSKLDWGYIFTINDAIVIPNNYLNRILKCYHNHLTHNMHQFVATNGPKNEFYDNSKILPCLTTLYHELIHIIQRNKIYYPNHNKIFEHIYSNIWGFHQISSKQLITRTKLPFTIITNPDTVNDKWVISLFNYQKKYYEYFLPELISDSLKTKPRGVLILLKKHGNLFEITNVYRNINEYKSYTRKFYGLTEQLYHPHEILANLLSRYVVENIMFSDHQDYFYFYNYINKYITSTDNLIRFK